MLFCSPDLPNMDWETWLQYLRLLDPHMYFYLHMCFYLWKYVCEHIWDYTYMYKCILSTYMIQKEYIHESLQSVDNKKCFHDTTHYTLATWCEELTHWKRPWCWEGLKAGEEGDDRGWDGWMASLTRWTWVWASSWSWWRTGKPGMLQPMGSQKAGYDCATELNTLIYQFF